MSSNLGAYVLNVGARLKSTPLHIRLLRSSMHRIICMHIKFTTDLSSRSDRSGHAPLLGIDFM